MRYCLGIESTAHTFGVGIVDFEGQVLSVVNDTYVPESGGLHPRKVVEHHNNVFMDVIDSALTKAHLSLTQIDLISFSQSPGFRYFLFIRFAIDSYFDHFKYLYFNPMPWGTTSPVFAR